jgi:signal transduction histidine kinase/ActR/RegA family two-component response regulator
MPVDRPTPDDGALRRYLRDLVAVSTLSAAWSRRDPQLIARDLADVICRSLPVAVAYVRLGRDDGSGVEAAGAATGPLTAEQARRIGDAVRAIVDSDTPHTPVDLFGDAPLYVSTTPIGLTGAFGIIVVGSPDAAFPSSVEQLLLSVPANQAAVVLQQRLSEGRLRMLWEAAAVLLAAEDPDVMMRGLFERVRKHLDVDTYFNYLIDEGARTLRLRSHAGIPDEVAHAMRSLEVGQSMCGTVAQLQRPIVATHLQQSADPKAQLLKSAGIRAYACNPLVVDGQLIGTLAFASRSKDTFTAEEIAVLETISHNVTIAYERIRLVEKLKETDRRKDEFLATLAHELRNPLAPVLNSLTVIRQCGDDRGLIDRATAIMDRQLSHMVRLVDDLLDAARITTGKLELRRVRVDMSTLLMNAVEANRPLIDQMGHELTITLLPMSHLYGDPVRLTQVISNLLNNAAKYTDKGGHIALTAARDGNDAAITIKDSGVGIPVDMQRRIFDTFAQVDRSLTRSQGGLGLGLTLVKQLVELHGGTVSVRSAGLDSGSEFTVRLPLAHADDRADVVPASRETKELVRLSVLVVDDNADAAESLGTILRLHGMDVTFASDGHEALRIAESVRPDVVILDLGLPGLDGYEVARLIRQQPWGAGLLLVAVSGWGQPADKQRSAAAGVSHHLVKPVNPFEIEQLLAGHGASINN